MPSGRSRLRRTERLGSHCYDPMTGSLVASVGRKSVEAGQEPFGNRSTRLPRRKPGSIVPPHMWSLVSYCGCLRGSEQPSDGSRLSPGNGSRSCQLFISIWILAHPRSAFRLHFVVRPPGPPVANPIPSACPRGWISKPLACLWRFITAASPLVGIRPAIHAPTKQRMPPIRRALHETVFSPGRNACSICEPQNPDRRVSCAPDTDAAKCSVRRGWSSPVIVTRR
jgi:hypothetical protein